MTPELLQKYLDVLTKNLSPPSAAVWRVALEHNYSCGIVDAVSVVIGLIFLTVSWKLSKRATETADNEVYVNCVFGVWVSGLLGLLVIVIYGQDGLFRFTQPHWMAAQDLINQVK